MPFGKYCRSNPLVFSFEPRCQGCCGSQKYTATSVARLKRWWSAISLPRSQVSDLYSSLGSLWACLISALMTVSVSFLDPHQHHVTGLTLDQGGDLAVIAAEEEIPFPVAGHRTILRLRWPLTDRDRIEDRPWLPSSAYDAASGAWPVCAYRCCKSSRFKAPRAWIYRLL